MLVRQILLAVTGLSAGFLVAGGLFGFIIGLGVISDFADRTRTASALRTYEVALAIGGSLGNIVHIYHIYVGGNIWMLGTFGVFSGIFLGGWAMALTEMLNVFPIFARRAKLVSGISHIVLGIAIGKGIGSLIYFWNGW